MRKNRRFTNIVFHFEARFTLLLDSMANLHAPTIASTESTARIHDAIELFVNSRNIVEKKWRSRRQRKVACIWARDCALSFLSLPSLSFLLCPLLLWLSVEEFECGNVVYAKSVAPFLVAILSLLNVSNLVRRFCSIFIHFQFVLFP